MHAQLSVVSASLSTFLSNSHLFASTSDHTVDGVDVFQRHFNSTLCDGDPTEGFIEHSLKLTGNCSKLFAIVQESVRQWTSYFKLCFGHLPIVSPNVLCRSICLLPFTFRLKWPAEMTFPSSFRSCRACLLGCCPRSRLSWYQWL